MSSVLPEHPDEAAWSDAEFEEALDGVGPIALRAAITLAIPDHLISGPLTAPELAGELGVHAPGLEALMDFLTIRGVFTWTPEGYALNPRSVPLLAGYPDGAAPWLTDGGPGGLMFEAFHVLPQALKLGLPAFELHHGAGFYDVVERQAIGGDFTMLRGEHGKRLASQLVATGLLDMTVEVVDVGGGDGSFLFHLMSAFSDLRGVLVDRPEPVRRARAAADGMGIGHRLELHGGDFFLYIPPSADTLLLSNVLHNWSDDQARRIVGNVAKSVGGRGRVLAIEGCLDRLPARVASAMNLRMFMLCGGKERTLAEYDALFRGSGLMRTEDIALTSELCVLVYRSQ